MAFWIKPVALESELITLEPLQQSYSEDLIKAASDGKLWRLWYTGVPNAESVDEYIKTALEKMKRQGELAFVVRLNSNGQIIGSTRFCNVDNLNHRVEIGYTWYAQSFQRSGVNTQAKYLLLQHAFDTLNAIAVEFRTHWFNYASRQAILRLGAKQDGVIRNHQRMENGSYRDTVVFSIINSEWLAIKQHLQHKMSK